MKSGSSKDVMKGIGASFGRLAATAIVVPLCLFGVLLILGSPYVASFPLVFGSKVVGEFFQLLPPTLELIIISFLVASIAGWGLALLFRGRLKRLNIGVALVLQSIPFFVLAFAVLALFYLINPSKLFLSVGALTLFHLPYIIEYFNEQIEPKMSLRRTASSILGGLATQFARYLPDIISATMIAELTFRWPGVVELFKASPSDQHAAAPNAGLLLFLALFVLVVRFIVQTFARTKNAAERYV